MSSDKECKFCSYCLTLLPPESLFFSCSHSLCFHCFPFLLYSLIEEAGLTGDFFQEPAKEHFCPICKKGKTVLPFKELSEFFAGPVEKHTNPRLCESCVKKPVKMLCPQCNVNYCENCASYFHTENKKFSQHMLIDYDPNAQSSTTPNFLCGCPSRRTLEGYCQQCRTAICKYCAVVEHSKHKQVSLSDLLEFREASTFKDFQVFLNSLLDDFSAFQSDLLSGLEETFRSSKQAVDEIMYEIVDLLSKVKDKFMQSSNKDQESLAQQLNLIKSSLTTFALQMDDHQTFHPNQLFELKRFLSNYKVSKTFVSPKLEKFPKNHLKLQEIKEVLASIKDPLRDLLDEFFQQEIFFRVQKNTVPLQQSSSAKANGATAKSNNVSASKTQKRDSSSSASKEVMHDLPQLKIEPPSNPTPNNRALAKEVVAPQKEKTKERIKEKAVVVRETNPKETGRSLAVVPKEEPLAFDESCNILDALPSVIEEDSFGFAYYKGDLSVSFYKNEESFIAWAGALVNNLHYPVHIYNLTQKRKQQILRYSKFKVNFLGYYSLQSADLLFSGDEDGDLRIFEFAPNMQFVEKAIIETNTVILEALLFEDRYAECSEGMEKYDPNDPFSRVLMAVGFANHTPVRIYNFQGDIVKYILNSKSEICGIMNFYYDEPLQKTALFFAFDSFIKQLDLSSKNWIKEFSTEKATNAIRFALNFAQNGESQRFIIYTQNLTTLTIADISTAQVIRQLNITDIKEIFDICVWEGSPYIVVAGEGKKIGFIRFYTFEDLKFVKGNKKELYLSSISPVNVRRVRIKTSKLNEPKECLVSLEDAPNDHSRIIIYEGVA